MSRHWAQSKGLVDRELCANNPSRQCSEPWEGRLGNTVGLSSHGLQQPARLSGAGVQAVAKEVFWGWRATGAKTQVGNDQPLLSKPGSVG